MTIQTHPFKQLAAIDVSSYVEKKGQFLDDITYIGPLWNIRDVINITKEQ